MPDFLVTLKEFIEGTNLISQFSETDYMGLFTNPWFLVPYIGLNIYLATKKSWNSIILMLTGLGVWAFTGTSYMKGLMIEGELQLDKIAPVIGVFIGAIAIVVYVLVIRGGD